MKLAWPLDEEEVDVDFLAHVVAVALVVAVVVQRQQEEASEQVIGCNNVV